ncbi:MAG: aminotransferase class I/II-fold pyridoxal phosphate-dependent enzyme, partial [Nitrososphaeraceae archaeon]
MDLKYRYITNELNSIKKENLYRNLKQVKFNKNQETFVNNKKVINLCSNDYLGISLKKEIIKKTRASLNQVSPCSSRLVSGNSYKIEELEFELAKHRNTESSLVFPTGYMANLGVISTLATKDHVIFSDQYNHASIIDACKLSNASSIEIFKHNDPQDLENLIKKKYKSKKTSSSKQKKFIIITEGIFSMDGNICNIAEISDISKKYDAILIVDDAHSDFIFGHPNNFGGILEHLGLLRNVDIHISSLSKALGSFGGYVSCPNIVRDLLINKSRTFIYTSAIPDHLCSSSLYAFEYLKKHSRLQKKLFKKFEKFSSNLRKLGFNIGNSESQIIPIIIGDEKLTMSFSAELYEQGIY